MFYHLVGMSVFVLMMVTPYHLWSLAVAAFIAALLTPKVMGS